MAQQESRVPTWSFADRLRKARTLAGLTQEDMAKRIGVPVSSYGTWEAGRAVPRGKVLPKLAQKVEEATGVPADWLLGLVDPQAPRMYGTSNYMKDIQEGYGDPPRYYESGGEPPLPERPFALHNAR